MKDIDFDELDRAVNSLMSSVPKGKPTTGDDDSVSTTVLSTTETATIVESLPDEDASSVQSEATDSEEPKQIDSASPQRRGRFMDMVRPAHRERDTGKPSLSAAVSRHGVTLQPSVPARPEETVSVEASEASTQPTSISEVDNSEVLQIDTMQELEDTASMATSFASPVIEAATEAQVSSTTEPEITEEAAPLSSPFLPDAKVEKRPLGRSVEPEAASLSSLEDSPSDATTQPLLEADKEEDASLEKDTQLPEQPLPAELDSKLLNIERDTSVFGQPTPPAEVPTTETISSQPPAASPVSAPPITDTTRAMAAASIPQQYKLEAASTQPEAPIGGIYDSQPLAHPAPSRPGWVWVAAIIAVLVLGALGGAAVYYLGLL